MSEPRLSRDDLFDRCAELRRDLADLVETLDDGQLATPSHCGDWDVRTVIAHLTVLPTTSRAAFALTLARSFGNMDRTVDTLSRKAAARPPAEIAATLRQVAHSQVTPPTLGARAPFTDLLVHTADARLPLGLDWTPRPHDAAVALGFLAKAPLGFLPRGRLDGVRLVATDAGHAWRDGADVVGTAADLLRAVCARPGALERVSGPGRDLLVSR